MTNTFARPSGFIAKLQASIYSVGRAIGGGDDIQAIWPINAGPNCGAFCQGMGGSAILPVGNYSANFSGIAGGHGWLRT